MSNTKDQIIKYLALFDKDPEECKKIIKAISNDIVNSKLTLLNYVEQLEPYLLNDSVTIRENSNYALTDIVETFDDNFLNKQTIGVLCTFFAQRLNDDNSNVLPCLKGIFLLTKMNKFSSLNIHLLCKSIFEIENFISLPQVVRYYGEGILKNFLINYSNTLLTFNDEFIDGYVNFVRGEKDPRNLMITLECTKLILMKMRLTSDNNNDNDDKIISDVKIGDVKISDENINKVDKTIDSKNNKNIDIKNLNKDHIDDLFDISFCYFPITFKSSTKDPNIVKASDLSLLLLECFVATPLFAKNLFPALIEKLNSSHTNVKTESLVAMIHCVSKYDSQTISIYSEEIWTACIYELYTTTEPSVSILISDLLTQLSSTLAKSENSKNPNSSLSKFLTLASDQCLEKIKVESKEILQASQALAAISSGSTLSSDYILNKSFPILFNSIKTQSIPYKRSLLNCFFLLVSSNSKVYDFTENSIKTQLNNPAITFKEQLYHLCSQVLNTKISDTEYMQLGISLSSSLISIPDYFSNIEVSTLVQSLNDVLLATEEEKILQATLKALLTISKIDSDYILSLTYPKIFSLLPTSSKAENIAKVTSSDEDFPISYDSLLYMLGYLALNQEVFDVLIIRIIEKINECTKSSSYDVVYIRSLLSTLLYTVVTARKEKSFDLSIFLYKLVPKLLTATVQNYFLLGESSALVLNETILIQGELIRIMLKSSPVELQRKFITDIWNLYFLKKPSDLILSQKDTVSERFSFFNIKDCSSFNNSVVLLAESLCGVSKSVLIPEDDLVKFVMTLFNDLKSTDSNNKRWYTMRLISIIVNKFFSNDELSLLEKDQINKFVIVLSDDKEALSVKINYFEFLAWVGKGMICRACSGGFTLAKTLVGFLDNKILSKYAIKACGILISQDDLLSTLNDCNIRLLHRQKFFSIIFPLVLNGYEKANNKDVKLNYLVSALLIFNSIPLSITERDFNKIIPLLVIALKSNDSVLSLSTLKTIYSISMEKCDSLQSFIVDIIPVLLKNLKYKDGNSLGVRLYSLKCLYEFSKVLPVEKNSSFYMNVTSELKFALNDPSRMVRHLAANCRQNYFSLQSNTN